MRSSGAAKPLQVDAVVLETDGSFSVVSGAAAGADVGTLRYVQGADVGD